MLMEIARENWPALLNAYRNHWPSGAVAYCLLDMQIKYPQLSQLMNFKVYCPEGIISNGMVATLDRHGHYQVVIQPLGENISKIEECLLNTKLIDWTRNIMMPSGNVTAIECLERLKHKLGICLHYGDSTKAYIHFLSKNSKPFENLTFPTNIHIGPLKQEHIEMVDKTWMYHSEYSHEFFELLTNNNLSYVLYYKDFSANNNGNNLVSNDNVGDTGRDKRTEEVNAHLEKPIAWLSVNEFGALTHLYCLKEYRKKGYAELLTKYVVNKLLAKGQNVIAYTLKNNTKPQNLFRKLGFEDNGYNFWTIVRKKNE